MAATVPHSDQNGAVIRGKTDARIAYEAEWNQLASANERLDSTRGCMERQRVKFENGGK